MSSVQPTPEFNLSTFFSKYIIAPTHKDLSTKQKVISCIASALIAGLTLGTAHLISKLYRRVSQNPPENAALVNDVAKEKLHQPGTKATTSATAAALPDPSSSSSQPLEKEQPPKPKENPEPDSSESQNDANNGHPESTSQFELATAVLPDENSTISQQLPNNSEQPGLSPAPKSVVSAIAAPPAAPPAVLANKPSSDYNPFMSKAFAKDNNIANFCKVPYADKAQPSHIQGDPRLDHGMDHCVRASLFAAVFASLYKESLPKEDLPDFELNADTVWQVQLLAACANSGRTKAAQTGNEIISKNQEKTKDILKSLAIQDQATIDKFTSAIQNKDKNQKNPSRNPIFAQILHDAISADFSRIVPVNIPAPESSAKYLNLHKRSMGNNNSAKLQEKLTSLTQEMFAFTAFTHRPDFREKAVNSDNYYNYMLCALTEEPLRSNCPNLIKHLKNAGVIPKIEDNTQAPLTETQFKELQKDARELAELLHNPVIGEPIKEVALNKIIEILQKNKASMPELLLSINLTTTKPLLSSILSCINQLDPKFAKTKSLLPLIKDALPEKSGSAQYIRKEMAKQFPEILRLSHAKNKELQEAYSAILINHKFDNNKTALHLACEAGNLEIATLLIQNKRYKNEKSDPSQSPIHAPAYYVNEKSDSLHTPLYSATYSGNIALIELLIKNGANINTANIHGITPIMSAFHHKQKNIVQLLSDKNAKVAAKDQAAINVYLKEKEKPAAKPAPTNINNDSFEKINVFEKGYEHIIESYNDKTPAYITKSLVYHLNIWPLKTTWCVLSDLIKKNVLTKDLLKQNGLIDAILSSENNINFLIVIKDLLINNKDSFKELPGKHKELFYQLCQYDIDIDLISIFIDESNINEKNSFEGTPLHAACTYGKPLIVQLLLDKGAHVNDKTADGQTPLQLACVAENVDIIKALLAKGANINEKTENGQTLLQLACLAGNIEAMQVLIEKGANINETTEKGETLLHLASITRTRRSGEIMSLLLKKGLDINAKTNDGLTPLMAACKYLGPDIEFFKSHNADLLATDNQGKSALDHLIEYDLNRKNHPETIKPHTDNIPLFDMDELENAILEKTNVSEVFKNDIIPLYANKYSKPFEDDFSGIEEDPKRDHGIDHGIRTALFTTIFASLHSKLKQFPKPNKGEINRLQIMAAHANSQKQNLWENAAADRTNGAAKAQNTLKKLGITNKERLNINTAGITESLLNEDQNNHNDALFLQNALSADYSRLRDNGIQKEKDFNESRARLSILTLASEQFANKPKKYATFVKELDAIRKEMNVFIHATHNKAFREKAADSPNYYNYMLNELTGPLKDKCPNLVRILTENGVLPAKLAL